MDLNKLRIEVFEKTGIRLDTSDPVFALVALNQAVLSESVEQHAALMQRANDMLGMQTGELIEAGERYKKLLQNMAALTGGEMKPEVAAVLASGAGTPSAQKTDKTFLEWGLMPCLAGAGGIAILSALLTLGGMALLMRRETPHQEPAKPAPPAIAALTPDQLQLMQNGEKYAKMWPKLDAVTQAKIQKLLQQP